MSEKKGPYKAELAPVPDKWMVSGPGIKFGAYNKFNATSRSHIANMAYAQGRSSLEAILKSQTAQAEHDQADYMAKAKMWEAELKSKDAEIARLREAVEGLLYQCDEPGCEKWATHKDLSESCCNWCELHAEQNFGEPIATCIKAVETLSAGSLMIVDGQPVGERSLE